ncbi:hypothetical protein ElyMa_005798300 [Elysia marginata]|uniref:Uncharacterized protein n=1 Tax=Elysia marginata TaxID=1093978 RepID=A0AAV4FVM1_9GAST|nr:hypothetical protein ElyMa_005798300 [Elysia marginata]
MNRDTGSYDLLPEEVSEVGEVVSSASIWTLSLPPEVRTSMLPLAKPEDLVSPLARLDLTTLLSAALTLLPGVYDRRFEVAAQK